MIKTFTKHAKTLSTIFNQVRSTSYMYNGLQWAKHHPDFFKQDKDFSSASYLADVKDRKVKFINEAQVPFSFKGTRSFKPMKRVLDTAVLDESKINLPKIQAKLQNYCNQYLKALSTQNVQDLPPCESNFLVNVEKSFHLIKNSGFNLELRHSIHELKEKGLRENAEIFEVMHISGLHVERALNLPIEYYYMDSSAEGRGLIEYNPKNDLILKREEQEKTAEKAATPENVTPQVNANNKVHPVLQGYRQILPTLETILRVYVLFTTSNRVVPLQDKKDVMSLDDYTFRHVAIFENQLRLPPVGALPYKEKEEVLKEYRLQEWKLVDFDGFMQGNPLLVEERVHDKLHYLENN